MSAGVPTGPDILTIADEYRAALIALEAAVTDEMIAAYQGIRQRLEADVAALTRQIQARLDAGKDVPVSWLYRQERYRSLIEQAEAEVQRLSGALSPRLAQLQAEAVILGSEAASAMLVSAGIAPARLPTEALVELVGRLSDGSPLSDLLDELGPDARGRIEKRLLDGITRGMSPRRISREVSDALGGNMARTLNITRTETLTAYRNANLAQYRQHPNVLRGWRWSASLSERTCAACLAQHGKVFPLSEPFASHPSCRCAAVPVVIGMAVPETGPEWFARQPVSFQMALLGPSKGRAYRDGAITLEDLILSGVDPRWGPWTREKSLAGALGGKVADRYYAEAAGG